MLEEVEKYLSSLYPSDHIAKIKEAVTIDLDIIVKRYLNSLILKDKNIEEQQQIITALEIDVKSEFKNSVPQIEDIKETLKQINLLSEQINTDDLIKDFIILPVFVLNEILYFDLTQTKINDTLCPQNMRILEEVLGTQRQELVDQSAEMK